jgi:hypothetical protein
MPSTAWSTDFPSGLMSRDRGSLALAPDQRLPAAVTSTPFWAEADDLKPPPAKRQRTDAESHSPQIKSAQLAGYWETVHPGFPLLPDRPTTDKVIASAEAAQVLKTFATVLSLLPVTSTQQNGSATETAATSTPFMSEADLSATLNSLLSEHPAQRSSQDNLVLIWTTVLLAALSEYDICSNRSELGNLSRASMLKAADDLAEYILTLANEQDPVIRAASRQAKVLAQVIARFDWFASGTRPNWSKLGLDQRPKPPFSREDYNLFSDNNDTKFLVRATYFFTPAQQIIYTPVSSEDEFAVYAKESMLDFAMYSILDGPGAVPGLNDETPVVRKVFEYQRLVWAIVHNRPLSPMAIMDHVLRLAKYLVEDSSQASSPAYNVLDYHLYAFTIIALLAFVDKVPDAIGVQYASDALTALTAILEQKATSYNTLVPSGFYGKDAQGNAIQNRTWMSALLKMIETRPKSKWAITRDSAQPASNAARQEFVEDFASLVRTGYGRVLAAYGGRGGEESH